MDKIHYLPTEGTTGFWGLRDVPVHPKDHPNVKSGMDQYSEPLDTNGFWQKRLKDYEKALESCKSNKLEIVNPEVFLYIEKDKIVLFSEFSERILKPGDIFDLPIGYEFEKGGYCEGCRRAGMYNCAHFDTCGHAKEVLRLVKTETKETCPTCGTDEGKFCSNSKHISQPEPEESQTEPIQNALYATGRFTTDECDLLAEGIIQYLTESGFTIQHKKQ